MFLSQHLRRRQYSQFHPRAHRHRRSRVHWVLQSFKMSRGPFRLAICRARNSRASMTGLKAPARTPKTIVRRASTIGMNTGIRRFHITIGEPIARAFGAAITLGLST